MAQRSSFFFVHFILTACLLRVAFVRNTIRWDHVPAEMKSIYTKMEIYWQEERCEKQKEWHKWNDLSQTLKRGKRIKIRAMTLLPCNRFVYYYYILLVVFVAPAQNRSIYEQNATKCTGCVLFARIRNEIYFGCIAKERQSFGSRFSNGFRTILSIDFKRKWWNIHWKQCGLAAEKRRYFQVFLIFD